MPWMERFAWCTIDVLYCVVSMCIDVCSNFIEYIVIEAYEIKK